jgi:hypothetical protein
MQNVEFNNFTEVNETTHPEKLKPNEFAQLDNMVIDKEIGIISTRNGFARYLQPDSTGVINNIFDVEDANQNNYLLANVGTKLRKYFSSTWTDIKTGLTAAKMRMAAYGASFIFTNGIDKPFYTDLTTEYDVVIDKPVVTGITGSVDGSVTNNVPLPPIYVLVYITVDGQKSNVSDYFMIYFNKPSTGWTLAAITLNNLPVSIDPRVIKKRLYRAKDTQWGTAGHPETRIIGNFYLVEELDNSLTTYVDVKTDTELDTTDTIEYLNTPNAMKYITPIADRIAFANIIKLMTNRVIAPTFLFEYLVSGSTALILDDTQTGNLSAGTYKYAVSFVDVNGNESALVPYVFDTLASPNKRIDFSFYRYVFAPVIYTNLYRTKANGSVYYFLSATLNDGYVPADVHDGTADSALTIPYPKATVHNVAELQKLPSSVIYSNLYNYLEYPELNYLEVFPDDSDSITGIFDDDNGIMVFKENSICKIYTNGAPENWQVQKLVHNMGCDQPDSIIKRGSIYYFVWRNKVYEWAGSGEPKCISYKRKPTFDSVTSFQGAAFYNSVLWYILTVKVSSTYYLLCYDTKLETWYKFTISQADTVFEKEFGTDKGKLLFGGNLYITYYNTSQAYDNDSGSTKDITIALKTKDYSFPDNFITARLMFLFINYYRLTGTASQQITFALTDPMSGISISITDWDETVAQSIFKIATDGMQGNLKRTFKLNFSISGEAISKFFAGRLDYNIEPWRVLQKTLVHKAVDDSGKHATDDTDRPASDDGGSIGAY